jgi:hypothetical protein
MAGAFYAFTTKTIARGKLPDYFEQDEDDIWQVASQAMLYSERGVWITAPVMSEPDESGDQTILEAGVRSKDFVVLVPDEVESALSYQITPAGAQGFA